MSSAIRTVTVSEWRARNIPLILTILGVEFDDVSDALCDLLVQAFTHSSVQIITKSLPLYDKLVFMGEPYINSSVSKVLFTAPRFTDYSLKRMKQIRKLCIGRRSCACFLRMLCLHRFIIKSERAEVYRDSVHADVFTAVIGALLLGLPAQKSAAVIDSLLWDRLLVSVPAARDFLPQQKSEPTCISLDPERVAEVIQDAGCVAWEFGLCLDGDGLIKAENNAKAAKAAEESTAAADHDLTRYLRQHGHSTISSAQLQQQQQQRRQQLQQALAAKNLQFRPDSTICTGWIINGVTYNPECHSASEVVEWMEFAEFLHSHTRYAALWKDKHRELNKENPLDLSGREIKAQIGEDKWNALGMVEAGSPSPADDIKGQWKERIDAWRISLQRQALAEVSAQHPLQTARFLRMIDAHIRRSTTTAS